jgi:hypothetical protein
MTFKRLKPDYLPNGPYVIKFFRNLNELSCKMNAHPKKRMLIGDAASRLGR